MNEPHIFYRPRARQILGSAGIVVLLLLLLAEFFIETGMFFGFYALSALAITLGFGLLAWLTGLILGRADDYYDET